MFNRRSLHGTGSEQGGGARAGSRRALFCRLAGNADRLPRWKARWAACGRWRTRPGGALAECGDFLFLAARENPLPGTCWTAVETSIRGVTPFLARDPRFRRWCLMFMDKAELTRRYAFHKGGEAFDRERLACFAASAPADVALRPFDLETCRLAMQAPWSRSFCEQFRDADDFLARGLGVAALRDGESWWAARRPMCASAGHRDAGGNPARTCAGAAWRWPAALG